MARTIDEIKQDMVANKEAEPTLSGLTSTSKVSKWGAIFYICAVAVKYIEDLFDLLKSDVEARRAEIPVGTTPWYGSESLLYQFGDELIFSNGFVGYEEIDEDKQVIDIAASDIINNVIVIKVAKLNNGIAEPLATDELNGFKEYWKNKRFAGESISIISANPDQLRLTYRVKVDTQILSVTGQSNLDGSYPVEDAINTHLQNFQIQENFNGLLRVMKLTDAIQAVNGVINVVAVSVEGRLNGGTYTDILQDPNQEYRANAGYMRIDPAYPLNTSITYVV